MPCFNEAVHLRLSVGSVQEQTYREWELVVVDDGSTDDSPVILETLAKEDSRIRVSTQKNTGPGAARNRGLQNARGELLAFLDGEDTWHREFLAKMTAALDVQDRPSLAYCGWQNLGLTGGRGDPFVPPDYEAPDKVESLLGGCPWPIHAALSRRQSLIERTGGFDESLTSCMDYDLWLRFATEVPITRVADVLAYYHHHDGEQITKNRARGAINHWTVQRTFLKKHPAVVRKLGLKRIRALTHGELMRRGYECYWKRDLKAARIIFRRVMRYGYGAPHDWFYMLPCLLPGAVHSHLLRTRDR